MAFMKLREQFVVKANPKELWRFEGESESIIGFQIAAFSPEGAAMKACKRGLTEGLKNYVVEKDGVLVASLYPMRYPLKMLLDAPEEYLLEQLARLRDMFTY